MARELADPAIEAFVRLDEPESYARLFDHLVPAVDAALAVGDVVVDGKMQLAALAESGFDPLSRTCRFMLTEEARMTG